MRHEIPASATGKIINAAVAARIRPEDLCRAARLDFSLLKEPENQMPFVKLIELYRHTARLTGDDAFGLHVGERDDPKSYGLLGYVTINSRTVGEALNRLIRYQQIRTDAFLFSMEITGERARLAYAYQTTDILPEERRHESEETLCSIIKFGRMITGFNWIPREVHFEHARPKNVSEHERIFRSPVRFGKFMTQIIFDASVLRLPIKHADLTLGSLLERQAEEELTRVSTVENDFVERVRRLIRKNLSRRERRLGTICREFGISQRTLHRKLKEAGAAYQKLLEDAQSETSKFYLRQPENAICEISASLGFSEPSAFHRAFRRWTGMTPQAFRSGFYQNDESAILNS